MRAIMVMVVNLVLVGMLVKPVQAERPTDGTIEGTVYQADGVTPITEVTVEAWRWHDGWYYETETAVDERGNYQLEVPPGYYRLEFWPDYDSDYQAQYYNQVYLLDEATTIAVKEGATVQHIDAYLSLGGGLQGQIMDIDGRTPITGWVNLYGWDDFWQEWEWWDYQESDQHGRYAWAYLPPGPYILSAETEFYPETFYDQATELSTATEITVQGEQTTTVDLTMRAGGIISGWLTAADGETPIHDMEILLYSATSYQEGWEWDETYTDEDGYYEFWVPAGRYLLITAEDEYDYLPYTYPPTHTDSKPQFFTITDDETLSLEINLVPSARIKGKISGDNGPIINSNITAYRWVDSKWLPEKTVDSGPQGFYTIAPLPSGRYRLEAEPKLDWTPQFLARYYPNSPTLAGATDIEVLTGTIINNINLTLPTGGLIQGKTTTPNGLPLPNVRVTPYQTTTSGEWQTVCCTMDSDSRGNYQTNGLPTGIYRLEFRGKDDYFGYYNQQLEVTAATDIAVQAGQTITNINMQFQAGGVITGWVTAEGEPVSKIEVTAYRTHGNWTTLVKTNREGGYQFDKLPPGQYNLRFFDPDQYYFKQTYTDTLTVVSGQTISNINANLSVGGELVGQVRSEADDIPLSGINVSVYQHDGTRWVYQQYVITDDEGFYYLNGLETGTYRLLFDNLVYPDFGSAITAKFASQTYGGGLSISQGADIWVKAGLTLTNINQTLPQAVTLAGQVTTVDGEPPSHPLQVIAHAFNGENWRVAIEAVLAQSTTTDNTGHYKFVGLPAGTYRIGVYDADAGTYITQYYSGAATVGQADEVTVDANNPVTSADVVVTAGAGTIEGQVLVGQGKRLEELELTAYLFDGTAWEPQFVSYTQRYFGDGEYELAGLGSGDYRLRATGFLDGERFVQYYPTGTTITQATTIPVEAGQRHGAYNFIVGAHPFYLPLVVK